ncbi:MAG: penicillin acylase family protein [Gemmatimonadota bacterium]
MKSSRRVAVALWLLVAFGALALAGGSWWLRSDPTLPQGEISLEGLTRPVEVLWDEREIPHIYASTEADAYLVQGYLHAFHRLWPMELRRRAAAGRLAEMLGEAALDADRFLRTVDLTRGRRASWAAMPDRERRVLEAYAQGVNLALNGRHVRRPPEFMVLRHDPEPWTPYHSLLTESIMAWDLAGFQESLDWWILKEAVGEEAFAAFRPQYPEGGLTILEDEGEVPLLGSVTSAAFLLPQGVGMQLALDASPPALAREMVERSSITRASNSWVLGGERTESGKPLVANDMHLSLDSPTLWYLMGIHVPGMDVVGMTLPGVPGVVVGRNAAVAWGFTNAYLADFDLVMETLAPDDSTRVVRSEGTEPLGTRREEIWVKGRDEPVELLVLESEAGPILSRAPVPGGGGALLAFQWVSHRASTTMEALLAMNRARDAGEFLEALARFSAPHQNTVFADTAGTFGYWMAGSVPLRRAGAPSLLPFAGGKEGWRWEGFLSFQDHPHEVNPTRGYVVTANHRQSWNESSALISDSRWEKPWRAMAIRDGILSRQRQSVESTRLIQMEVRSPFAQLHLTRVAQAYRGEGMETEARLLDGWDGGGHLDSEAAPLFWGWVSAYQDELGARLKLPQGRLPLASLDRMLEEEAPFAGELDGIAAEAARGRVSPGAKWGEVNQLHREHLLEDVPVLGSLLAFRTSPLPREGSLHSPNVSPYSGGGPPFRVRHGPSQRAVMDLGGGDHAGRFSLPGEQSGFPASAQGGPQVQAWREGTLWPLPLDRATMEPRTYLRTRFVPVTTPNP